MSFADPQKNLRSLGLEEGMEVADLGAGPGHYAFAAAQLVGSSGHVYAAEIQKDLVEKVKNEAESKEMNNVDVLWCDLEKANGSTLSDMSVDAVILSNVLFQIQNKDVLLAETYRILKPGGRVLVIDWSDSHGGLGPTDDHLVNIEDITTLATETGFSVEKNINPGAHHWGIVLVK